jgi:hypothetical protein
MAKNIVKIINNLNEYKITSDAFEAANSIYFSKSFIAIITLLKKGIFNSFIF